MSPREYAVGEASGALASADAFRPAIRPRDRTATRLLVLDPATGALRDAHLDALASLLDAGDVLVVNDAATLPASLRVRSADGVALELRLAEAPDDDGRARAVLFGPGDWRQRTEDRAPPPVLAVGAWLELDPVGLTAEIEAVSPLSPRLLTVHFHAARDRLDAALYGAGRPIQYAYLESELPLWAVQTAYAARPWAVEPASAGLGLTFAVLLALRRRGVVIATITHAAGLSSTGDPAIDRALPLPERSDVPAATVEAIAEARAHGHRVIAVGTTVVRALEGRAAEPSATDTSPEGASAGSALSPGVRITAHRLGPGTPRRVVDGLITGMHAPGESHYELLQAFASADQLARACAHARAHDYLAHELGDAMLVL